MKTKTAPTTEQPKHTQGIARLPLKDEHADTIIIETQGLVPTLAICQSSKAITKEEAVANASRMVKCWNMHDELIEFIKRQIGERNFLNDNDLEEAKQLLKQSEGK